MEDNDSIDDNALTADEYTVLLEVSMEHLTALALDLAALSPDSPLFERRQWQTKMVNTIIDKLQTQAACV